LNGGAVRTPYLELRLRHVVAPDPALSGLFLP
jgi:hypothetical protein